MASATEDEIERATMYAAMLARGYEYDRGRPSTREEIGACLGRAYAEMRIEPDEQQRQIAVASVQGLLAENTFIEELLRYRLSQPPGAPIPVEFRPKMLAALEKSVNQFLKDYERGAVGRKLRLRDCRYCGQTISTTALYCPACLKTDDAATNWMKGAKKAAKWAALFGAALVGPNAIVGAVLGPQMNRPSAATLKTIAGTIGAIDSVHAGTDMTIFFTRTGFVWMFLYDLGKNPAIPKEIPYSEYLGVRMQPPTKKGEVEGYAEYRIPPDVRASIEPPRRPKPMERLLLGKKLYEQMLADADEFGRKGPPTTSGAPFSFSGKDASAFAQLLSDKFDEYARSLA
ncbi:MAG TPA: hypothetical protein VE907_12280 [Gammaproteobacteria bacterium]|nr:hypothetical protein [Gammaproteobacteria bacterium]